MKTNVFKHALFSAITNLSNLFIFVLMIFAGRTLGAEQFGEILFAHSLAFLFLTCVNFGLHQLITRDVARDKSLTGKYLGNALTWIASASVVALGMLVLTALCFHSPTKQFIVVILLMGIAMTVRYSSIACRAVLQAHERFDIEAVIFFTEQLTLLVTGVSVLAAGFGILGLACAFLGVRIVGLVLALVVCKRRFSLVFQCDPAFLKSMFVRTFPIGIAHLVSIAYLHVDTIILSRMLTYADVGYYNAAFKIYTGLMLFPGILSTILFPKLSVSFKGEKQQHNRIIVWGSLSMICLSICIGLPGFFFAKQIIFLSFGTTYSPAVTTMQTLFIVLLITFQTWFLRYVLIAVDRQKALMVFNALGLIVRIGAAVILIHRYGVLGAGIAAGISQLFLLCSTMIYLFKKHFRIKDGHDFIEKVLDGLKI